MFNKRKISIILIAVAVIGVGLYWRQPLVRAAMQLLDVAQGVIRVRSSPKNGLVGYWNFDECDSCTTAADKSGNGNMGTMYDGATAANLRTSSGKIGNGISLDGTNDFVDVGSGSSLDTTGSMTVSLWLKLNGDYGNMQEIIGDLTGGVNCTYQLEYSRGSNTKFSWLQNCGSIDAYSNRAITDNNWHQLAVVRSGSIGAWTIKFYIDGVLDGTTDTSVNPGSGTSVSIGRSGGYNGYYFKGSIDDVHIYNRALSADEITRLYEEGSYRTTINANQNSVLNSGLTGMWSFNGPDIDWASTTAEILDKSGNGLNGNAITLTNKSVRSGIVGQALNFSAANSEYIELASSPFGGNLHNGIYTVAAWAYPKSINSTHLTILSDPWVDDISFFFGLDNNGSVAGVLGFVIGWFSGSWNGVGTDDSPSSYLNKWTHVVGTYDGATFKIYINGVLDNQKNVSRTGPNNEGSAEIGRYTGGSNLYWDGMLDEVRFYNRALNATEIQELYLSSARL